MVSKIDDENVSDLNVVDIILKGKVNYVINTIRPNADSAKDGFVIRRISAENAIPCFTSLDTANAILKVMQSQSFSLSSMK